MRGKIYRVMIGCFFVMLTQTGCSLVDEAAAGQTQNRDGAGLEEPAGADADSKADAATHETRRHAPVRLPACAGVEDCPVLSNAAGWCSAEGRCRYSCEPGFGDANRERTVDGCECRQANGGVEACNGADDDCDGVRDNIYAGGYLSAAGNLTCVTSRSGALRCTGDGEAVGSWPAGALHSGQPGQLGQVSAGLNHGCALGADERVYCWGANRYGQAVPGGGEDVDEPTPVDLPGSFVDVASGAFHSCALSRQGEVYCWGRNEFGQLGDGSESARNAPVKIAAALEFVDISAGSFHACAATREGRALCWGANFLGQAGQRDLDAINVPSWLDIPLPVASVTAGRFHSCALTRRGRVYCWGANQYGQLGDGTMESRSKPEIAGEEFHLVELSAGGSHTCGLSKTGRVYCWGSNASGALGVDGDEPVYVWPRGAARSIDFSAVQAGGSHTCGLSLDGRLFCWGRGDSGQLGAVDARATRRPRRADCS
jgi:hypothetical protein